MKFKSGQPLIAALLVTAAAEFALNPMTVPGNSVAIYGVEIVVATENR
ncbi:MAG: hypothetical protein ABI791_12695 [Acidobacteriota bacterium]